MYGDLEKQMKILIENIAPRTNYCKTCTIAKKYDDGTVDVIADFGEYGRLNRRPCIGNPKIDDLGLLVPLNDDWNNSIVVAQSKLQSLDDLEEEIVSIQETIIEYGVSSSNAVRPTVWSTVMPEVGKGQYLWTRTTIIYSNGERKVSYTVSYQGKDGGKGDAGTIYDFIYYTTSQEVLPPTPTNDTAILDEGYECWTNNLQSVTEVYKYAYISYRLVEGEELGEFSTPALWSAYGEKGATGEAGEDGADGEGLEMIFYKTATKDSFTLNPATIPIDTEGFQSPDYVPEGWSDNQQGVEPTIKYEYVSIRTKGSDGVWNQFNQPKLWATYSEDGKDGDSVRYIYCRSKTLDSTLPALPSSVNDDIPKNQSDDPDNQVWCDDPAGPIGTLPYEWMSKATKENNVWSSFSTPVLWAIYSFDGEDGLQGIQGDKGENGQDGKDGTTLPDEILDKLMDGQINADFLNGYSSDDFVLDEIEEVSKTITVNGVTGDITARRQGRVVNVYIRGVNTLIQNSSDYNYIDFQLPQSMLPDFNGRLYGFDGVGDSRMCIETDGRIGTGINKTVGSYVRNYYVFTYIKNPVKGESRFRTATGGVVGSTISVTSGNSLVFIVQGTGSAESSSYSPIPGANVVFTVNGVEYPRTADSNGVVKLNINLNPGTYTGCSVKFNGDTNNKLVSNSFTLNVNSITSLVFNQGTDGTVTVTTGDGGSLAGESYQVTINGVITSGVLDGNSSFKVQLNNYSGTFSATITILASLRISGNITRVLTFTGTSTGSTVGSNNFSPGQVSQITCSRCRQYNNVTLDLVINKDEQYIQTSTLASASGTYNTPAGLSFTGYNFNSIPSSARINKITATVVYGQFGPSAVSNAGSFDAPTLQLTYDGGSTATQDCTSLDSSTWNKWVSSTVVFTNVPRSALNTNFSVQFVPKQNKSGNIPYFAFDYIGLNVEYIY